MTAVTFLMGGDGGEPQDVVICRVCEARDPDLAAARKGLGLPFLYGIARGAHASVACQHPDHATSD